MDTAQLKQATIDFDRPTQAVLIPLGGNFAHGRSAIVDAADEHLVTAHNWIVGKDGYVRTTVQRNRQTVSVLMHYLILGDRGGLFGDHRDRDKLNNRRGNLRIATRSQNNANRRIQKNNRSGFKGVRRSGGRFQARLHCDKRVVFAGMFDTAEEAARAYDHAANEHFGEFAYLNFPQSGQQE